MMRVSSSRGAWAITTKRPASSPNDESFFSVVEAIIRERDTWPGKHLFGVLKPQTVFGEVTVVLRFVPFVSLS
jgi:hypothetical protein